MKFIAPIYISRWRGSDSTGSFGWCTQGQNLNLSSQESQTPTIILPHVQWKKDTYINIPYNFFCLSLRDKKILKMKMPRKNQKEYVDQTCGTPQKENLSLVLFLLSSCG